MKSVWVFDDRYQYRSKPVGPDPSIAGTVSISGLYTLFRIDNIQCSVISSQIPRNGNSLLTVAKYCLVLLGTSYNNLLHRIPALCYEETRQCGWIEGVIHIRIFMNETSEEIKYIDVVWVESKISDMFSMSDAAKMYGRLISFTTGSLVKNFGAQLFIVFHH